MFRNGTLVAMRCLPNRDHMLGGLHRHLIVERGKRVDAFYRMADRRIDEQQNPIDDVARQIERLSGGHDRFAEDIAGDAPRLRR